MSYLTADQFIHIYDKDPSEALQSLNNHRIEIPSLFTTLDEVMLLGTIVEKKLALLAEQKKPLIGREYKIIEAPIKKWLKESAFKIVPLFKNHGDYIALLNTSKFIAIQLLEQDSNNIASLFTTYDQFMELFSKNQSIAKAIFKANPKEVTALFTTREQFMALESRQHISFISNVFKQDPDRIAGLFASRDQFIELVSKSYTAANDILRHAPKRITELFTTYDQFMALLSENQYIAKAIFKENPDEIAALFTTREQFMALESKNHSLAQKVSAQHPDRIAAIRNNKDTSSPAPAYQTIAPRQSPFSYSSSSASSPMFRFNKITRLADNLEVEKNYSPQPVSDIDYSFYLKCLARLAVLAGGILLVVTGFIIASQPLALLGGVIAVAGGISVYQLFSAKDSKKQDNVASQRAGLWTS